MTDILSTLALRCEGARGPDRELFLEVAMVAPEKFSIAPDAWCRADGSFYWANGTTWGRIPDFYASLDCALQLVPEGWAWAVGNFDPDGLPCDGCAAIVALTPDSECDPVAAATPALALCAASLRARAAQADDK